MKTLQECKDQVAESHGLSNWAHVVNSYGYVGKWVDEAAELYARAKWNAACEAQRMNCFNSWWDYSCTKEHDEDGFRDAIKEAPKPEFKP